MKALPLHDKKSEISYDLCHTFKLCPALKISRLQRIGCILGYADGLKRRNSQNIAYEESYLVAALKELAQIDEHDSARLFTLDNSLADRFELSWQLMSDHDRAVALWMNYDHYNNYWPYFDNYNLSLLDAIHLETGTPESLLGAPPYHVPTSIANYNSVVSHIDPYAPNGVDADMNRFPDFQSECMELRDMCKIFRYSHFQWIGCILERRDVYEISDRTIQIHDDRIAIRMLTDTGIEHSLAQALVIEIDWRNRFKLVWRIMSDYEKSMALNTDYDAFNNFWPGLEFYNLPLDKVTLLSGSSTGEILEAVAHASHQAYLKENSIRSKMEYDRLISERQAR